MEGSTTADITAAATKTAQVSMSEVIVEPSAVIGTNSPPSHSIDTNTQHYESLLETLTLDEKISLLSGTSFTSTASIPRLNVPALKLSDSITGVRGSQSHLEDKGTTCFPSTTCIASTWDRSLLRDFGEEVGIQAKLKSVQVVLGPNLNLQRDPRAGRNFETFSEDPLLTGQLAACIVNGVQSTGVGACAKHFVCNESETKRRKYNVSTSRSSRTVRELYMKAFQYMLRDSNPVSIMTAYNKLDGDYCCQTPLIREVIRNAWKYDGCIMSDWYGTTSSAEALVAGLDLEMPGPSVFRGQKLLAEIKAGRIDESHVDSAARSVLGMIDKTIKSHSVEPERTVICERTSNMALRLATEGVVLLKNERNALPVDMVTTSSIALIGPGAVTPVVSGGGSACAQPQYVLSMVDCFKSSQPSAKIGYAVGYSANYCVPVIPVELLQNRSGAHGIDVEYYNNDVNEPVYSETLGVPQLVMLGRLRPGLNESKFHFVITTTLKVDSSDTYILGAQVTGDFCLDIDGSKVLSGTVPDISTEDFLFVPKKLERTTEVYLEAHKSYSIRLLVNSRELAKNGEPTPHAAKLVLQKCFNDRLSIAEAVTLASESDVSVIVAGRTHEHESEGFDLENLTIDPVQARLIKAVSAVSRRTVLVLNHGNPIDLSPIIDDVDAIIAAHFPGQEGSRAVADIILGRANPSGRLTTTWPMRLDADCVPSFNNFPCTKASQPEIEYAEGLQVGYRSPSARNASRFPFGHGLSYSKFLVSALNVHAVSERENASNTEREWIAQVLVRNEGPFPGRHVVQLYVEAPQHDNVEQSPWRPQRELISFAKPYLGSGESKMIEMKFLEKDVTSIWDEQTQSWRPHSGKYTFAVADNAIVQASCSVELEINTDNVAWHGL